MRKTQMLLLNVLFLMAAIASVASADEAKPRRSMWIDLASGEPLGYENVLDDLAGAGVIYIGERHTLQRHHDIQQHILDDLAKRKIPLVLGLEQLESYQQPILDRYNRGEIDFDEFARKSDWAKHWDNYRQYRPIVETARKHDVPVLALNARAETIRQVARGGGVERLEAKLRAELPAEMQLDDPLYAKLLSLQMMVHAAANPERLRPMIEAQIARDESMAAALCEYLKSPAGKGRTAVVLCGSGHVAYGLGTASRVRRRLPEIKERIIVMSESGEVELSPAMKAQARPITISHQQLRDLGRPLADYLQVTEAKSSD
jgi:uncharacterized iron-regulated protein